MGYLRAWRQNVAVLALGVLLVGGVVVAVWRSHSTHTPAPGETAIEVSFSVTGAAPGGVAVLATDSRDAPATVISRKGSVPFRATAPVDEKTFTKYGIGFFEFQAELLNGGRITCTVRIGSVTEVKRASGPHGRCSVSVARDARPGVGIFLGWHPA